MPGSMKIAVTGATGRVGRHVVDVLAERGHQAVPMSRTSGVDVVTGAGMAEALEGVEAVIDTATYHLPDEQAATDFFLASARNLQEYGQKAGVQRIVEVSIVGVDRNPSAYNRAKLAQQRALLDGPVPVKTLRATQFHEFVGKLLEWSRQGDVAYMTEARVQPVAARAVAEAVVDLALDPTPADPEAPVPEIAGPREENLAELARLLVAKRGDSVRVEEVPAQADPSGALEQDADLLPNPGATLAGPTFAEWLDANS